MKIVIAPDSYKESLSALEVATQIEAGFQEIFPTAQYVKLPMADGGEGTVEAMVAATNGKLVHITVTGPLGVPVDAFYGMTGDGKTAVIEMAAASGLEIVPPLQRNPLKTTSYGTGELVRAALDAGARHLIIGIGGSATNDGGAGMVQALGARLLNRAEQEIGFGGEALAELDRIDIRAMDHRLSECRIDVACDVNNPLTGKLGASAIFGPQKGATPAMIVTLDQNLEHFARLIKRDLGRDVSTVPGAGAAGGMGAALLAFCGANLRPGIEIVMEAVNLEAHLHDADLVITGEGRIDSQTVHGKTAMGVAGVAKKYHKPVIGVAGSLSTDVSIVHSHGIDAVFSVLYRICSLDEALQEAAGNVKLTARNVAATVKLGNLCQALA